MPNHVHTSLTVTAPDHADAGDLLRFVNTYRNVDAYQDVHPEGARLAEPCLSHAFLPMPLMYRGTVEGWPRDPAADGLTWYNWANDNWGTKWGTYNETHTLSNNRIVIDFDSAWCPPWALLATIRRSFPSLEFTGFFMDEVECLLHTFTLDKQGVPL